MKFKEKRCGKHALTLLYKYENPKLTTIPKLKATICYKETCSSKKVHELHSVWS
jgi:hypothetical protein